METEYIRKSLFNSYMYYYNIATNSLKVSLRSEPFTISNNIYINRYMYYSKIAETLYNEYNKFSIKVY